MRRRCARDEYRGMTLTPSDVGGQAIQSESTLEVVHHRADARRLKDRLELRMAAGAPKFVELGR
jgi:hypothetical protein